MSNSPHPVPPNRLTATTVWHPGLWLLCSAQALGSSGFMLHLHQSALFSTAATTAGCLGWTHELRLPVAAGLFCCKRCGHMRCCLLLATHVADLQTFVGLITCNLPYLVWLM